MKSRTIHSKHVLPYSMMMMVKSTLNMRCRRMSLISWSKAGASSLPLSTYITSNFAFTSASAPRKSVLWETWLSNWQQVSAVFLNMKQQEALTNAPLKFLWNARRVLFTFFLSDLQRQHLRFSAWAFTSGIALLQLQTWWTNKESS